MAAYRQIQNLDAAILSDVDGENFDKAFGLLRSVVRGSADFGKSLTKTDLDETYGAPLGGPSLLPSDMRAKRQVLHQQHFRQ